MKNNIKVLQTEELKVMKIIKEICEKENIRYFMIGGTLLGAIRHSGFIPWDDDVDLAMPRKDYERFLEVSNKYLPSNIFVQNFRTDDKYRYYITRVLNKNILVEEKRFIGVDTPQAYASVDIFQKLVYSVDGLPAGEHTVKIEVLGEKSAAATSTNISIDKLVIKNFN